MTQSIESIADLYDALGGESTVNFLVTYDSTAREWLTYLGDASRGTSANLTLAEDTGIFAAMNHGISVRLGGDALGTNGISMITLNQGTNLVGIPLRDSRITRVSDLLVLEGIRDNVPVIVVSDNGAFKVVGRAGDDGDIPITGGQSFLLTAQMAATLTISGEGWKNVSNGAAAPPMVLTSFQVGNATPVLVFRGSIVGEMTGVNKGNFRVTVKNLSTGRASTTVTGKKGGDYQLTVVDTETARAAQVGDILEISAQSPDALIGVQPLRYTVTTEDVRRSRIQLPTLVVYEIPTETALLLNYPNPFNPETWIPYRLAEDACVALAIYDLSGNVVRTLEFGYQAAAVYESRAKAIYWNGRNEFGERVASGLYFYTLTAGDFTATRKMLVGK